MRQTMGEAPYAPTVSPPKDVRKRSTRYIPAMPMAITNVRNGKMRSCIMDAIVARCSLEVRLCTMAHEHAGGGARHCRSALHAAPQSAPRRYNSRSNNPDDKKVYAHVGCVASSILERCPPTKTTPALELSTVDNRHPFAWYPAQGASGMRNGLNVLHTLNDASEGHVLAI